MCIYGLSGLGSISPLSWLLQRPDSVLELIHICQLSTGILLSVGVHESVKVFMCVNVSVHIPWQACWGWRTTSVLVFTFHLVLLQISYYPLLSTWRLVGLNDSEDSPVFTSQFIKDALELQMHIMTSSFMWVLTIQTPVLTLVGQGLYPLSHLHPFIQEYPPIASGTLSRGITSKKKSLLTLLKARSSSAQWLHGNKVNTDSNTNRQITISGMPSQPLESWYKQPLLEKLCIFN